MEMNETHKELFGKVKDDYDEKKQLVEDKFKKV